MRICVYVSACMRVLFAILFCVSLFMNRLEFTIVVIPKHPRSFTYKYEIEYNIYSIAHKHEHIPKHTYTHARARESFRFCDQFDRDLEF